MTEQEEYVTMVTWLIDNNIGIFLFAFLAPPWIKTFINSAIINKRDKTNHFILFLNPFSESAWKHMFEIMFRFYWKNPTNESTFSKKLVNYISITWGAFIFLLISSHLIEAYLRYS